MLSLIYNTFQYVLKRSSSDKTEIEDINEVISHIEHAEENTDIITEKEEKLDKAGCYYKTGCVTQITQSYILIDDCHMYEQNNDSTNLKIGDKVQYMAFKRDSNEKPIVKKIICVIDDQSWDNANTKSEDVHTQMIPRSIVAKVANREGRIVIVKPNNIRVDLSKVQSDFIPLIGDWLVLESLVELNDNSTDLSGEILEVDKITPLRSKLDVGIISKYNYDSEVGIIDKQVIFHKRACEPGYIPRVGDKVVSDSIESDQGLYSWRSLNVVPLIQNLQGSNQLSITNSFSAIVSDPNDLLKNKYGIIIDDKLKFNLHIEEESTLTVVIQNNGSYTHMLQGGSFMRQNAPSQLSLESPINTDIYAVINPSENIKYTFKCKAKFIGTSEELFVFNFKDFKIGRLFHITVNTKIISRKTDSSSIAQRKDQTINILDIDELNNDITHIPGIRPCKAPNFIQVRTGIFRVPQFVWNTVVNIVQNKKSQTEMEIAIGETIPCLLKPLSFETYKERFHTLLYLEEIAITLNLQRYNIESTSMRRCGDYLALEVLGLAERRPSLLVGDKAIISFPWNNSQGKLKYEGYIHKVTSTEVFLKFNEKFHHEYNSEGCQVTFSFSKSVIQRLHNAVNLALGHLGNDFLFPTKVVQKEPQFYLEECEVEEKSTLTQVCDKSMSSNSSDSFSSIASNNDTAFDNITRMSSRMSITEKSSNVDSSLKEARNLKNTNKSITQSDDKLESYINLIKKRKLNWFNKKLNHYQKEAVRNILKGLARPLPYVIFGPPGTGKTITLCETILQILTVIPESRLLVATPSNSAANLIAERLLDSNILKPGDLVRLIAHHCLESDVIPKRLLPYCATADLAMEGTHDRYQQTEGGMQLNCTKSVLGRHRITIGTCSSLGILYNMGFPRGHFSHILIDEAGQATEPEIMIPMNFIHSDHGQVVLTGDPMQLGPVVQSQLAQYFGLGESFLSRLLHQFPYQRDPEGFKTGYDPRLVTKLLFNYRSLPEILNLPNSLFYESELCPQISVTDSKEAKLLQILKAELPQRNGSPPAIVFHGINGENCRDLESPSWYNPQEATQVYLYLLRLYKYGLEPNDIGVITPYLKQVLQIKDLLLELNVKLPKVSSVEGFQGQERKVIILSTVRSCNNLINEDVKHALGFIASPKRFNVALTRARSLLIILGNPTTLSLDPYWRSVLTYCINHDAYTGCNFNM
ncbi:probable RNA helicase armi [Linepithema humile]|uniref:probable RNA helicase armi n=1 Tax=Linepithema humile TaxID=83485 RepID=UPI00351F3E81